MFIISLNYIVSLDQIDSSLQEHVSFLKAQYKQGNFIASGRKIPRTGGIILATAKSVEEINAIVEKDPFFTKGFAQYEITEFSPTMTVSEFDGLQGL